jgi:hypothetical protein
MSGEVKIYCGKNSILNSKKIKVFLGKNNSQI